MGRIPKRTDLSARSADGADVRITCVQDINEVTPLNAELYNLDELALAKLISFFRLLDRWDRERKPPC